MVKNITSKKNFKAVLYLNKNCYICTFLYVVVIIVQYVMMCEDEWYRSGWLLRCGTVHYLEARGGSHEKQTTGS